MKTTLFLTFALLMGAASGWALTPSQLTAAEKTTYDGLKSDPAAASAYLATRAYLKLSQRVAAKSVPALSLTDFPDNFDDKYLTTAEQEIIDKATNLRFAAMMAGPITA